MRWWRVSLAGATAVVAGVYVGLFLSRFAVTPIPTTAPLAISAPRDPRFRSPYIRLGVEALEMGRLVQARAHFNNAVKADPNDYEGYSGLGGSPTGRKTTTKPVDSGARQSR